MKIVVLGAGAGGGLPQWNCGCDNCKAARRGEIPSMTQSSVAVSADGVRWVLLNASPDIRAQMSEVEALHPTGLRDTPVSGVVLTNGDIDHIAGLLTLREKTHFTVYATRDGMDILDKNSVFNVLDKDLVARRTISVEHAFSPAPGLSVTAFSVPGKVALFLEEGVLNLQEVGEQTIGLLVDDGSRKFAYLPGCAAIPDWLVERMSDIDLLLFDGTVWENDDMQRTGTGEKTGARMGHIPMTGSEGSLSKLSEVPARKVFVHINNTNPILNPDSTARQTVLDNGWEIAFDGMELNL